MTLSKNMLLRALPSRLAAIVGEAAKFPVKEPPPSPKIAV
jgi:hypothetical protein